MIGFGSVIQKVMWFLSVQWRIWKSTFQVCINHTETDPVTSSDYLQCRFLDYNFNLERIETGIEVILRRIDGYGPFINAAELYKILDVQNTVQNDDRKRSWAIGISAGCSMLFVLVVICIAFIWRHRHRSQTYTKDCPTHQAQHSSRDEETSCGFVLIHVDEQSEYRMLAIEYTEDHIKKATKNYSTVIGKGSFGSVFYGRFSGADVAVKVLSTDSNQGQVEFHNELTLLSRIHHINLVNLVGYCRQPVVALVYEYMECGSLKDHLYGLAKLEKPLDWNTRLNIAVQAAEGLLYLHRGCNPPIIHRDIKCNNILLDGNMCAKVADFGLSKVIESSESYVSTIVKGTIGYLDPQYLETSALTEESDVYSFGVVLLEILSGVSPKDGIVESVIHLLLTNAMSLVVLCFCF